MRTIRIHLKYIKYKNRNYVTSEENGSKRIRSVIAAGGFVSALVYYFVVKETKPYFMEQEITFEPQHISFNDDIIGALDQKEMFYQQELKAFKESKKLVKIRKLSEEGGESLLNSWELPPILKFFSTITLPRPPSLSDIKTSIRNFISTTLEVILPDSVYNYKDSEFYQRFAEVRLELREVREEAKNEISNYIESWTHRKDFTIPKMLLPPPLPYGQPPITILIDDNILFHDQIMRSGGEYFMRKISQFSETVWNSGSSYMQYLAPNKIFTVNPPVVHHRLSVESWTSMPTKPIQMDLSRLNRDLSKVLVLSTRKDYYKYYPANVLIIPEKYWWTEDKDTDLFDLVPVIKHISDEVKGGKDVREILKYYEDVDPAKLTKIAMEKSTTQQHRKAEAQRTSRGK